MEANTGKNKKFENNKDAPQIGVQDSATNNLVEPSSNLVEPQLSTLSKNALKKLRRRQEWLDSRNERRLKEKEKRKAKIAKRKLENPDLPSYSESRKVLKKSVNAKEYSKVHIIFDFGFSKLMNQRDRGKCLKQLLRCYSMNRRYEHPMNLHITSFEGEMKGDIHKPCSHRGGGDENCLLMVDNSG